MRSRQPGQLQAESSPAYLYYWLLVALFIEYARPASFFPFLNIPSLYSAIPLLLLLVTAFAKGLRPVREIFADPLAKWIFIYLGLVFLSASHADVTEYVYRVFRGMFGYVSLFFLIARIATTEQRIHGIVAVLLVAHVFLMAMNPDVMLTADRTHYITGATFLGDGNDYALSLCLLFPLALDLALNARRFWARLLVWSAVAIVVLAIIATQSRGATLGMAVVLIYLWMRSSRKMLSLFGIALVGIMLLLYAPASYFERMGTIANFQNEGSAQGRIEAWKASMRMAADNPLTGVGAGHFPISFGTKYRTRSTASMPWLTAHSSYFLVLGELGLPGLFCLLMLVIGNFRADTRLRREILARAGPAPNAETLRSARMLFLTSAATLGFASAGAFLSAAYYPHIFVLTGLVLSVRSIAAGKAGIAQSHAAVAQAVRSRFRRRVAQQPAGPPPDAASGVENAPQPKRGRRASQTR